MDQVGDALESTPALQSSFTSIRPGGHREPLIYDPKGYFVITLDRAANQIIVRHYLPDHTPAHEMRGRTAESMMLGLLREGLVSQLSHAGYLGGELAKAESAMRLGPRIRYEQDRPFRRDTEESGETEGGEKPSLPLPPRIETWEQLAEIPVGQQVDVAMQVTSTPQEHLLEGKFAGPAAKGDWTWYRRTDHVLRLRWSSDTRVAMGTSRDFQVGAVLRTTGILRQPGEVEALAIAVLTKAVTIK